MPTRLPTILLLVTFALIGFPLDADAGKHQRDQARRAREFQRNRLKKESPWQQQATRKQKTWALGLRKKAEQIDRQLTRKVQVAKRKVTPVPQRRPQPQPRPKAPTVTKKKQPVVVEKKAPKVPEVSDNTDKISLDSFPEPIARTAPRKDGYKMAVPVPGSQGMVYSPFDTEKKVDVRGMPSGLLVKDPYTGGMFRVP